MTTHTSSATRILGATENLDTAAKNKHGTLGRGLRAIFGGNKLKRNNSVNSSKDENVVALTKKDKRRSSSIVDLFGGDSKVRQKARTSDPPKDWIYHAGSRFPTLGAPQQQSSKVDNGRHPTDRNKDTVPGIPSLNATKMIAPHNPPPPVPLGNGAVFPKRTPVGAATDFLPNNTFKSAMNGSSTKQNGASQPPAPTPSSAQKPVLIPAPAAEKDKSTTKEHHEHSRKDSVELTKYPKIKLNGYVGFSSLPYQVVRRSQKQGFQFNLLCVGETGTGKTTLIESLFGIKLNDFEPCSNELNTVELRSKQCEITDSNVNVKLRIVETAGFGDQLDKEKSAKVIVDFINAQYEARLKEELMVKRCLSHYEDSRIHVCLYMLSSTGHGLKALDVVAIKELAKRVNVIPVIAKSDTISKDELARFKSRILAELRNHSIEIYQFPTDDEAVSEQNRRMNSFVPFAVIGSIDFVTKEDGSVVRARKYPWGCVEVENKEHCDFIYLREAILRTNVDALRERTHNVLYEAYRKDRLRELKMRDGDAGPNMEKACELRQRECQDELHQRDKRFNEAFVRRVDEKEVELKRRDELLNIRRREMEDNYQNELRTLEQKIVAALEEKSRLVDGRNSDRSHGKKSKK